METGLPRETRQVGHDEPGEATASPYALDIEIDEPEGRLRIYDPRAFHAGRRGFCRRLLEAAAEHPDLRKAQVDLDASVCLLDFHRGSVDAGSMADAVTAAVRRAAAGRDPWWPRPASWSALTVYRAPDGDSWWETLEARPGHIRLRHTAPARDRSRLTHLAEALAAVDGIDGSRASRWSGTIALDYRPESPIARGLLDALEQASRGGIAPRSPRRAAASPNGRGDGGAIEVAHGLRRFRYLAMAGGCFAMAGVGLVVPGIPTVPFLLATSYYLARSSPRLNARLRRTALFGPILVEWERHRGLSRASRAKLIGLTAAIIVVTVVVGAASPAVLVVVLIIALASLYAIARLPGLPPEALAAPRPDRPGRIALAAPSA